MFFLAAFTPLASADAVIDWNRAFLIAVQSETTPPPLASRNLAILHVAMFDAVNAVTTNLRVHYNWGKLDFETIASYARATMEHDDELSWFPETPTVNLTRDGKLKLPLHAWGRTTASDSGAGTVGLLDRRRWVLERFYALGIEPGLGAFRPQDPLPLMASVSHAVKTRSFVPPPHGVFPPVKP